MGTRYARTVDNLDIAYRTWGEGEPVHLFLSDFASTVDTRDMHPALLRAWSFLAKFGTVLAFDRRGLGASERVHPDQLADLDAFVLDMLAVLDAANVDRAVVSGEGGSAAAAIKFAVEHPERTLRLAVINGAPRVTRSDDYPVALFSPEEIEVIADTYAAKWGTGSFLSDFVPALATDQDFVRVCAFTERHIGPPSTFRAALRAVATFDVRHLVPEVRVPTFVAWTGDILAFPSEQTRDLAERFPNCTYVEAAAGTFYEPDESGPMRAWGEFIAGGPTSPPVERRLTTLLFIDVVGSTDLISTVGDAGWSQVLGDLDAWVGREIHQHDGVFIKHTGDGYLARFETPGAAVRTAVAITRGAHTLGVEVRAGVHIGEVELRDGGDVGGLSVHIAARVMAAAGQREVLVTRTVGDLLAGSEFDLADRGEQELKGVPGKWQLFAVLRRGVDTDQSA